MSITRRNWLKLAGGTVVGGVGGGLTIGELGVSVQEVQAATQKLKLSGAKEFTSACNFCSCGCGMVCHVKDGKLVNLEGDPDHVINEGSLCSKGASVAVVPASDQRVKTPMYRAPGSDKWQAISWDEALEKVARKLKATRDANWIATEKDGDKDIAVNRTDALGFLGGAQNTNEECYLMSKMSRLFGTDFVEHQARL
jgi:formate dehydrogenase major subunit